MYCSQPHRHSAWRRNLLTLLCLVFVLVVARPALWAKAQAMNSGTAAATWVYWTEMRDGRIMRGNADGSGSPQVCVSGQSNPRGLVLAPTVGEGKMYWIERDAGQIRRANLDCSGSGVEILVTSVSNGDRLALDVGGSRMYWTENDGTDRIRSATLTGTNIQVVHSGLGAPVGIALDTTQGHMYWTELRTHQIWRSSLSGTGKVKILDLSSDAFPLDIVLDVDNNRMYWGSTGLHAIYTADLNGNGAEVWRYIDLPRSLAIDLDGNKLYWADHGLNVIQRDNLDKSNLQTLFNAADGLDTPLGVATYGSTGVTCYPLTRDHTGQGNNPSASPAASTGCANGKYTAGQSITLTATPAAGWSVSGWSGTNNDGSTATTNTVTMPAANHTVTVSYIQVVVDCYTLTRDHTGQGNNPSASPAASTGCANGKYTAGQSITLTAAPAAGWQVSGWSGTNNDGSTGTTNTLTMPAANHTVSVIYQLGAINYDFFVPFVTHVPFAGPTCYSGPDEGEDNDSHDQATGPLCQGTFLGLPNDQKDFFYFDTKAQGNISVVVTGHRGEGVQLQLYYGTTPLDDDTEQEDGLSVAWPNGAPGRYYVILYTETPKPNETRGYSLQVSYP